MSPAQRLEALERGENPLVVARMRSGFAVMSNSQFLPGYCLLLGSPIVSRLNDLEGDSRTQFLEDMATLGDAIIAVTGAVRVNYGIYGNLDPFVHAHVWPRYAEEPEEVRTLPPMQFPIGIREAPENAYDPARHDVLRDAIRAKLHMLRAGLT
jgi:diadenosine tetraphosphate (Ap4A) HIT family hydrolase